MQGKNDCLNKTDLILIQEGKHISHMMKNCFSPERTNLKKITKLHGDEDLNMK